jgi:hypothetical protein
MSHDPVVTNPGLYKVIFENERVRVLEYRDQPGDKAVAHHHPDSVMCTLTSFARRLVSGDQQRDLELEAGQARWVGAQEHAGENIGDTETHAIFVELKEPAPIPAAEGPLGPSGQ